MTTSLETANIALALTEMARARPFAMAIACPAGRDRAGRAAYAFQTFQQLDRESDILARGLTAAKIARGVRTALMVKPGHELFALTFALFKAGAVPILIDPGIGLRNMKKCLDEAEPGAFVGIPAAQIARRVFGWGRQTLRVTVTVRPDDGRRRAAPLPDMKPRPPRPGGRVIHTLDESGFDRGLPDTRHDRVFTLSLAQVRRAGLDTAGEPFEIAPPSPSGLDAILFTSGSTGTPKGVVYSHEIFQAQVTMLRSLYGIEPGEIDLCTFPLFSLFAPALGMTSIIPAMDASRPARVDPSKIVDAIETFAVTNMFGSPALLKRVGEYGLARGLKLPTLRRVISAGAPVPARVLEHVASMLAPGVQIFTPYGATESLPVASIGSDEILGETRNATDRGAGVCVGRPVPGMRAEVMRITEDAVPSWSDDLVVPAGTVGEIVVQGPVVTQRYYGNLQATLRAKIYPMPAITPPEEGWNGLSGHGLNYDPRRDGPLWHRIGDLGYIDDAGRLWFCGRKTHRVMTAEGTLFTIPCEAVFNTHLDVSRTALVGVGRPGRAKPVLCVELESKHVDRKSIRSELLELGARFPHTRSIETILFHPAFPVDVRHNAKIYRDQLAVWAARRVR